MKLLHRALCLAVCLLPAQALSQAFPAKPIRIVVPFSAGGPTDITARLIGPRMTELLGQPIVIDNRAGATGIIGAELVAKSPADGYTLLFGTASVVAINMVTYSKLPYDTLRDFQALTPVMTTSTILVVHPSVPAKSLKELSSELSVPEKELAFALEKLAQSLRHQALVLGREAAVHLVECRPLGDVREHHRAFHDVAQRIAVGLERGPDVFERLPCLALDAA